MISIKEINEKDIDLCYELDSDTISLWSKKQWANDSKRRYKVFGLLISNLVIGICVFQIVLDETRLIILQLIKNIEKRFGTYLMNYLIKYCENMHITKLFLEVSQRNVTAEKFYSHFNFCTIGIRRKYYKDGSDAILKEKKLSTK